MMLDVAIGGVDNAPEIWPPASSLHLLGGDHVDVGRDDDGGDDETCGQVLHNVPDIGLRVTGGKHGVKLHG